MANNDITSANASLTITSPTAGNCNVTKFAADGLLDAEPRTLAETRMTLDGNLLAGYVPAIRRVTIHLEATSNGIPFLMALKLTSDAAKSPIPVILTVTVPSQGKRYVATGFMTQCPEMPNLGTTVQPMDFVFECQDIVPVSI